MEDAADAVSRGDGDDGAVDRFDVGGRALPGRRLPDPPLLVDLFEQIGDPDVAGPAGVQGRLHGGADVVGVDVAVPEPVATHDHDRVTHAGPDVTEGGDGVVGRFEEVHHLIAELSDGILSPASKRRPVAPDVRGHPRGDRWVRHGSPGRHEEKSVEQQDDADAAGVHDSGLLEHGELVRRRGQRRRRSRPGGLQDLDEIGAARRRGRGRRLRRGPHDGEDGAFDRTGDGAVGAGGRPLQGGGHGGGAAARVGAEGIGDASQDLGEDDAGIAPRSHERSVGDGPGDRLEAGLAPLVELEDHRLQGEGHVGPRVAVGHRVDVEAVDQLLVRPEGVAVGDHGRRQVIGPQSLEPLHGRRC